MGEQNTKIHFHVQYSSEFFRIPTDLTILLENFAHSSYLENITTEVSGYPGILFGRSRFINYEEDFNKSDRGFIDFMDKKEISRSPLTLCVFSSLYYSIVSDAHASSHFPYRRTAVGTHLGLMKCILKYNSWVCILGTKRILKQVRSSLIMC